MNTKKLLLLLVAMTMVFSLTALAAKAPATVTSKTVKLSGKFDKIAVSSGLEVDYTVNHSAPEAVISGLKEYIVVDTDDVLMICPRAEEQNIKKFIDEVKYKNGEKHI